MGFEHVYITTGYELDQFQQVPGLTAVLGKEPPPSILNLSKLHF